MGLPSRPVRILCALSVSLVAACSFAPTYERPAPPVPGAFPYPSATQGVPAAELGWQKFFADERLKALIGTALANNRDLRVAILAIEQARAQYDIRNADRFPTIGATVTGSRAPGSSGNSSTVYTAGIGTTAWEVDLFGRVASLSASALAQYLATEEGRKAAQTALIASVATAWLNVVSDEELLKVTQDTLATREESLRLTKLRFENGASSEIDYRLAESLAETARALLAQLQRQRAQDINALGLLVGQAVAPDFRTGVSTDSVTLPDLPAGTPSDVLVKRPDVRQAEEQLIAANANIGAARAAFFPRITLTAGIGSASSDLSDLFKGGAWGWTVAPALVQTIFDFGRNRAGVASATAQRDIAIAQYERAIQSAFREVSDALAGRATFGDQLAAQTAVVRAETVRTRLAKLRYDNGVASYLDFLDAQRSLFAAQQLLVQVRLARLQNQVQLYRVLGGGWLA
ncbi:MAG TPA: efflux transporter outer membrane subunit [Ramlibacter sp.]|uniref:efflux transporter outer membrane subunit n=1 Tax=Ramlibacter sp. TaxID=1917967 RepID=UPI002CB26E9B|nr:efflux transporter outer membrane subunit [Ramlibacter sp.]HVZ44791.1 efflux transporter outer membrane subunit [Ramlibacter sp.]